MISRNRSSDRKYFEHPNYFHDYIIDQSCVTFCKKSVTHFGHRAAKIEIFSIFLRFCLLNKLLSKFQIYEHWTWSLPANMLHYLTKWNILFCNQNLNLCNVFTKTIILSIKSRFNWQIVIYRRYVTNNG